MPGDSTDVPDTWLLVFAGPADWPVVTAGVLARITPGAPDAHFVLSREHAGERRSLLLVHWTDGERDHLLSVLEPLWDSGFVNRVEDLDAGRQIRGSGVDVHVGLFHDGHESEVFHETPGRRCARPEEVPTRRNG